MFGGKYRPAHGLSGNAVTANECNFIERGSNATKYLQIDRLFLLRDFNPDFEKAEIRIYITVRGHIEKQILILQKYSEYDIAISSYTIYHTRYMTGS